MTTALQTLTSKVPFKHYRNDGEGTITRFGYVMHGSNGKKKFEHVLVVEKALGHELPAGAEIHHINENRQDNRATNLVVCQNKAYHKLLHVRATALETCGNANFRKCPFCKQYDDPKKMMHNKSSRYFYHATCKNKYRKERNAK